MKGWDLISLKSSGLQFFATSLYSSHIASIFLLALLTGFLGFLIFLFSRENGELNRSDLSRFLLMLCLFPVILIRVPLLGSSQRYWFAEPSGGDWEEEAQAQASRAVSQFLLHGKVKSFSPFRCFFFSFRRILMGNFVIYFL